MVKTLRNLLGVDRYQTEMIQNSTISKIEKFFENKDKEVIILYDAEKKKSVVYGSFVMGKIKQVGVRWPLVGNLLLKEPDFRLSLHDMYDAYAISGKEDIRQRNYNTANLKVFYFESENSGRIGHGKVVHTDPFLAYLALRTEFPNSLPVQRLKFVERFTPSFSSYYEE